MRLKGFMAIASEAGFAVRFKATYKVTSGRSDDRLQYARWTVRSLSTVLVAVSAAKRSTVSPTWRDGAFCLSVAHRFVSGCCASYASLRRAVNGALFDGRSEDRRVGKECVRTCRS